MAKAAAKTAVEKADSMTLPEESTSASLPVEMTTNPDISTVAYQLWEQRGRPEGDPDRDWYEAERQIRSQNGGG